MAVMPIPSDWDGESWCCYVVEWPDSASWQAILLGFLTTPQRGRFWDGRTGSITAAQAVGLQIFQRNFLDCEEVLMAGCLEDLATALNQIALSLQASAGGCGCQGSGGAGTFEAPASTFVDDGENFPAGYSDRQEYEAAKCDLTKYILDRLSQDMERLGTVNAAGQSAATLSQIILFTVLLTPIPFDDLLVIVSIVLELFAIAASAVATAANELSDFFANLDICLLYGADDAEGAKQAILEAIDAFGGFTYATLTKSLASNLISFDGLNLLFDPAPPLENLPAGDCSSCACPGITMVTGARLSQNSFQSAFSGNGDFVHLNTQAFDADLTFSNLVGYNEGVNVPGTLHFRVFKDGGLVYNSDAFPNGQTINGDQVVFGASLTQFTFQMDSECP